MPRDARVLFEATYIAIIRAETHGYEGTAAALRAVLRQQSHEFQSELPEHADQSLDFMARALESRQ